MTDEIQSLEQTDMEEKMEQTIDACAESLEAMREGTSLSGSSLGKEELQRLGGEMVAAIKTVYDPRGYSFTPRDNLAASRECEARLSLHFIVAVAKGLLD